jgi:hypothetical protein
MVLAVSIGLVGLASGCGGKGQPEEFKLAVTLAKTTPRELIMALGPPLERATNYLDRPIERLHFNVPYYRVVYVEILDQDHKVSEKIIRGKSVLTFLFVDGVLSSVD